jgi:mannosyltransferase
VARLPRMAVLGEALTRRQDVTARWATPAVLTTAALTVLGLALRLVYLDQQSLFADELSTAWVVTGQGLGGVIDRVQTDQEITPPLYFVITWVASKLGDSTWWLQVPSLLVGAATIPLVYVLGARTVGRPAAAVGSAITALSPYLIFYSTEARAYGMVLFLALLSTLALLAALDTGRRRWWAAYAALSCAVMYTHYSGAFVLAGQALWALWAHRESWRALLVANGAAAIGFLPWLPSYIDDSESPTTNVLGFLHPFGFDLAMSDLARWAVGFPLTPPRALPGTFALVMLASGIAIAIGSLGLRVARRAGWSGLRPSQGLVLVVVLALSTPVGAGLFSLVGQDVFAARNLIASSPGLALSLGGLLTGAATLVRVAALALVLSAYCVGTVKLSGDDFSRPDYDAVAGFIDRSGQPGDTVIDVPAPTGGPITALEAAVGDQGRVFVLGTRPRTPGPVEIDELAQFGDPARPAGSVVRSARRSADSGRLFLAVPDTRPTDAATEAPPRTAGLVVRDLPPRYRLAEAAHYPGTVGLSVYRYEDDSRRR